jgi:hypothetical protein
LWPRRLYRCRYCASSRIDTGNPQFPSISQCFKMSECHTKNLNPLIEVSSLKLQPPPFGKGKNRNAQHA